MLWMMDQATSPQRSFESAHLSRLLSQVATKDSASLKSLYDRTAAKLYGIAIRLLGDESEAQDLLQDVYVTVWRKASSFDSKRASAITWLATITRNRAIDRIRARRNPGEDLEAALDIPDDAPSSLDLLEREDDAVRLRNCLDELEERARRMIRAAFFDGATYPELAARENVPLPTLKSWVRRGLLRLRGCLDQ